MPNYIKEAQNNRSEMNGLVCLGKYDMKGCLSHETTFDYGFYTDIILIFKNFPQLQ